MEIIEIKYGSKQYHQEVVLRDKYLRKPLGLKLSDADMFDEENQWHFGVFDKNALLASVTLNPISKSTVKLRQMVVSDNYRKKGLGRMLIDHIENEVRLRGINSIELASRIEAKSFYESLGYTSYGDEFVEIGLTHIGMQKCI